MARKIHIERRGSGHGERKGLCGLRRHRPPLAVGGLVVVDPERGRPDRRGAR